MAAYLHSKASLVALDHGYPAAELQKIPDAAVDLEGTLDRNDMNRLVDKTVDVLFALVNLTRHIGT